MSNTRENKIKKNIQERDLIRTFPWILKQFKAGRLYLLGGKMSPSLFENFRLIIKKTAEIYDNNWDIDFLVQISMENRKKKITIAIKGIIVHFPDILISNSRKKEHLLKDLFIKLTLQAAVSGIRVHKISGARTTFSRAELLKNYSHSHLHSINVREKIEIFNREPSREAFPFFDSFCLGSGHINDFLAEYNSSFKETHFEQVLIQLMRVASWESLEGTPYINFENMSSRSHQNVPFASTTIKAANLFARFLDFQANPASQKPISLSLGPNGYFIKDELEFEETLKATLTTNSSQERFLCIEGSGGNFYTITSVRESLAFDTPIQPIQPFYFAGKERPFMVSDPPKIKEDSIKQFIFHPELKTKVKNEFEYHINQKAIRQSTLDKYESNFEHSSGNS